MKTDRVTLFLLVGFIFPAKTMLGQTADGQITYLSGNAVYTDIGTVKGAGIGDTLFVTTRPDKPALIIQSISRKSSLSAILDTTVRFEVGTRVIAHIQSFTMQTTPTFASDTVRPLAGNLDSLWSGAISQHNMQTRQSTLSSSSLAAPGRQDRNLLQGRIGLQYYRSADRNNSSYNYYQPGVVVNVDLNRVQGSHYSVSTNTHIRKTYSDRDLRSANYPVRVYELALKYQNDALPYSYQMGRVSSPVINGIGYFDGGIYSHRLKPKLLVGGFVGTEPDYRKSTPQTTTSKLGVYVNYGHDFSGETRSSSTLAFSGQYVKGNIDREFIYLQNDLTFGSRLYVYQNAELGINRSVQSRRNGTVELSNIYLMARYRPIRTISVTGSYDARKNVFLVQTYKSIPDTLFDDALRQGLRGDVSWRATRQLTVSVSSSVRTRAGDAQNTWLHSAGFYYYNLLETQLNLNFRFFTTSTSYTTARSFSYSVSRQFSLLYASVSFRTYAYELQGRTDRFDRQSASLDLSYDVTRKLFATAQYEYSNGKDEKADRIYMELSYRF